MRISNSAKIKIALLGPAFVILIVFLHLVNRTNPTMSFDNAYINFKFGDNASITEGFYAGCWGYVMSQRYDAENYHYFTLDAKCRSSDGKMIFQKDIEEKAMNMVIDVSTH